MTRLVVCTKTSSSAKNLAERAFPSPGTERRQDCVAVENCAVRNPTVGQPGSNDILLSTILAVLCQGARSQRLGRSLV
jgi:hypothetical protein